MSNFTVRRFLVVASMLICQLALADDKSKEPPPPPDQPEAPFKLLAALKPVSMEDVDKVVEASDKAVQGCNRKYKRVDTLAVLMSMTIDGDGNVTEVDASPESSDGGKAPAEAACLAKVAKKLKFPATGTVSHVQYPFMIVSRVKTAPSY